MRISYQSDNAVKKKKKKRKTILQIIQIYRAMYKQNLYKGHIFNNLNNQMRFNEVIDILCNFISSIFPKKYLFFKFIHVFFNSRGEHSTRINYTKHEEYKYMK